MESLRLAAVAGLLLLVGAAYLTLLGAAAMAWLLPRRWLPFAAVAAPLLGWAALVAIAYPLNCALPFEWVAWLLGAAAVGLVVSQVARGRARLKQVWGRRE